MLKAIVPFVLIVASSVTAQPIQWAKCAGIIHGVVYGPSGEHVVGVRVVAFPVGVPLGVLLPKTKTDQRGEYLFEHICHGKYTVMPDDPEAGYPHTSPGQNEFLYGTRTRTVTLSSLHNRAELPVNLPARPGILLLHVRDLQTKSEIHRFHLALKVPGQRISPDLGMYFDMNDDNGIPVPSAKAVVLVVNAEGYKDLSKSISFVSGATATVELSVEKIN